MTWTLDGRPLRAVLVTRLRYLGDVAMATVVAQALRDGDPGLDIGFLCEDPYAPALTGQPFLRRIHPLRVERRSADARARTVAAEPRTLEVAMVPDADEEAAGGARRGLPRDAWGTIRALRAARYDLAVDLFFNPRSAILLRASGTRLRIGGRAGWRQRLYTHLAGPDDLAGRPGFRALAGGGLGDHLSRLAPLRHDGRPFVDWFLETYAQAPPRPRLARRRLGDGAARAALAALGIGAGDEFVLLAPGATWPSKEWPTANWQACAARLLAEQARPLVVLSPPLRGELYAPLVASLPRGRGGALPPLSLTEALRVVSVTSAVVTVDGGIMHAAVAMGRPTVALFGPTAPEIWFPYERLGPFRVLATRPACHPCDLHVCDRFVCLPDLRGADAAGVALQLLAGHGSGT